MENATRDNYDIPNDFSINLSIDIDFEKIDEIRINHKILKYLPSIIGILSIVYIHKLPSISHLKFIALSSINRNLLIHLLHALNHLIFYNSFQELWKRDNEDGSVVFGYIAWRLRQFCLDKAYKPIDVLSEVYTRGIELIYKDGEIWSFIPWLKSTGYHIILEWRRSRNREEVNRHDYEQLAAPVEEIEEEIPQKQKNNLWREISLLKPLEQEILKLRVLDSMSWERVREEIIKRGHPPMKTETLRKRFERIRGKLQSKISKQGSDR